MVKKYHLRARRLVFAALLALFVTFGVIAAISIVIAERGYAASRREYEGLRQVYSSLSAGLTELPATPGNAAASAELDLASDLSGMNSDYAGWIRIGGTSIDCPIVQGEDDAKYLSTTFTGERNASGTIFMDSRCAGFDGFTLLYGHNMRDGSMFAGLNKYLKSGYREQHPEISITTAEGATMVYRIFAVKETDVNDMVYTYPGKSRETIRDVIARPGMPEGAGRLLVLSTCAGGGSKEGRLLVFAAAIAVSN